MLKTGIYYALMHNKSYVLIAEIREKFDRKKCVNPSFVKGTERKPPNPKIFLWYSNLNERVPESLIYVLKTCS